MENEEISYENANAYKNDINPSEMKSPHYAKI